MKRGDYDYNHATTNFTAIVILIVISMCLGVGLTLGLIMLNVLL